MQVIYCPLPTSLHLEWVPKIAKAGKHVLIEKPTGLSAAEVEEMIHACRCAAFGNTVSVSAIVTATGTATCADAVTLGYCLQMRLVRVSL